MAILSGQLKVPQSAINPRTLKKAGFQGPTMPWIDPQKEITAEEKAVRSGFKSRAQVIRERGGNPQDVFEQIKQEREQENEAGISFTTSQPAKAAADNPSQENEDEQDTGEKPTGKDAAGACLNESAGSCAIRELLPGTPNMPGSSGGPDRYGGGLIRAGQ